ncbi:hypothetical protein G3N56_07965 [Desulfovibrio sulfodismutans]|uniref:Zinc finger CHC2-type domain-containing protein n=1 Tax=Desulfolutivibrio sulfodismutans TaxID=63561 RepID=A0A7K3NKE4_9BACT|nr:hypothetical protein [Desulfolutivibrio sulfodismutans]NDY56678.1 hypothetical protein [Desulfolutivibrio sulfodismutans]QLA11222.1 hypothetical protein GD606_02490 [Desulfolutivibrio sulfodismutans DSM 3696]
MGAAQEWLGAAERADIARGLLTNPEERGGEVWAHCPFHQENTPGGAFSYDPAGDVAHCCSCGETTDLIGVFNAVHGRDAGDADGFRDFKARYAPDAQSVAPRRDPAAPRKPQGPPPWTPKIVEMPNETWRAKATAFVTHAAERLQSSPDVLAQLAAWGITADTAKKCRIGWNQQDKYPPRSAWGLPKELKPDGTERKIWLPEGLVLPFFVGGEVVKIKIRRPHPELGPESLRDKKYWEVNPGGAQGLYFVYGRPEWTVWVIIETERDAAMVWQHTHPLHVGVMGTGSATAWPDATAAAILSRAALILLALDSDQAGAKARGWWEDHFPASRRWPAPPSAGKDPGEAIGCGLDIRAWVLAGIPSHVRREMERRRDLPSVPAPAVHAEPTPAPAPPAPALTAPDQSVPSPATPATPAPAATAVAPAFPDIPGIDWSDPEMVELWEGWPESYPGRARYFEYLGFVARYPVGGVRMRRPGGDPARDGLAFRADPSWERGNRQTSRRARELFWADDVQKAWLARDWPDAPVVVEVAGDA